MIEISTPRNYKGIIKKAPLQKALEKVLSISHREDDMVTVTFMGDRKIQSLNAKYRGLNQPTDVLSFAANESDRDSGLNYLGDIVISYPRAVANAELHKNKLQDELILLVVHGALHLLGHDHKDKSEKRKMWELQNAILDELNITVNID